MRHPSDEIIHAAREQSLEVHPLSPADRERLRDQITAWYGTDRIWESNGDAASLHDPQAWRWIGEFVGSHECILLFDSRDDSEMLAVPSGAALTKLLGECTGFEFYVTDRAGSYLVCFNHHDVLVCWGRAREWLISRQHDASGLPTRD